MRAIFTTALLLVGLPAALLPACADSGTSDAQAQSETQSEAQSEIQAQSQSQSQDSVTAEQLREAGVVPQAELRAELDSDYPTLSAIADPQLSVQSVRPTIDVLIGSGGNVAALYGRDGALLVDDKFARNADEILARLAERGGARPVWVLNTHYHGDHSGANAEMRAVGATVLAHRRSRELMTESFYNELFGRDNEVRAADALPDLTFDSEATLHFRGEGAGNGSEAVRLIHFENAHTGGDTVVHFQSNNVFHMGDIHFNGMFPVIDFSAGGNIDGMIAAQDAVYALADADTVIIPGHGPVTDREGLRETTDQLRDIRARIQSRIEAGEDLATIQGGNALDGLEALEGFIDKERITLATYASLTGETE